MFSPIISVALLFGGSFILLASILRFSVRTVVIVTEARKSRRGEGSRQD
jgi:hypothetical protein